MDATPGRGGGSRDGGVAWLGEVPEGWEKLRLRDVATLNPSKQEAAGRDPAEEVSFVPMEAVGEDGTLDLSRTRSIESVNAGYTYFAEGDVAVAKITPCFENGKGAVMRGLEGGIGFGTTELTVVRPDRSRLHTRYLHWLFLGSAFRQDGHSQMYGAGGQKRVPDDAIRNHRFALPPLPEQRAIASFLDARTAEIDALVARQRRLIALLHEKKSAVIGHAVTRGLDPDAPLKPSGIEWLGDVPEHWTLSRLKFALGRMTSGGTPDTNVESYWCDEGGSPFVAIGDMSKVSVVLRTARRITEEGARSKDLKLLPKGTILFSMYASLGETAELGVEAYTNQAILSLVPGPDLDPYWLQSWISFLKPYLGIDATTNTQVNLNAEKVGNLPVLLPPIEEMQDICAKLAFKLNRLDFMEGGPHRAIELLLERRSALISAAVTGKLRVPH